MLLTDTTIQKTLRQSSFYLISTVLLIAVLVIIGWQFNIDFLKKPLPHLVAMNPVTALCFILSTFSFFFLVPIQKFNCQNITGKILAVIVLLVGLTRFSTTVSNINIPIDTILFHDKMMRDALVNITNRMASNTAFCFILTGISLLAFNTEQTKKRAPSQYLLLIIVLVSLLSVLGYLYNVQAFYGILVYIPMSIHGAICFLLLSLALLFAHTGTGPMKEFTGPYAGSITARRLIPAAILLPVLFGYLRLMGHWAGIFTTEFGVAILILSIIIVFMFIIWYNMTLLNKRDFQNEQIKNSLRESEEKLSILFNSIDEGFCIIEMIFDKQKKPVDYRFLVINPSFEKQTGLRDAVGKRMREFAPDHEEHWFEIYGKIALTGESIRFENRAEQLHRWYEVYAFRFGDPRNLQVGILFNDITERKKNEVQIQNQKQDIQDFIDSMSTLSAKLSIDGKILLANKTAQQASGVSMEELLNTHFTEGQWWTFDPEVHARVCIAFKKACSGTAINYDENIFVFGQVLTINFSLIPILNPDGGVEYIVAEGRDITAQKRAEEKIKESESMFSSLFYQSPVMKAITDIETSKYVDVNDAFATFWGFTKEEMLGKTSVDLNMLADSEEREEVLAKIRKAGFAREVETKTISKSGKVRWISSNVDTISINGKKCFLAATIDITSRKEAEEKIRQMNQELEKRVEEKTLEIIQSEKKFRSLIENSTDVFTLMDKNFKPFYRSPSAARVTGWTDEEREQTQNSDQIHPDDIESLQLSIQEVMVNPGKPVRTSFRALHKKGYYIWTEGTMTNKLDDESVNAIIVNMRDVTESKKAQDQLQASETRFRSIIEQFPYPVVTYASGGDYTNANVAWEKMWHYSREDVKGYNIRKDPQMIASGLSGYVEKAFAGEVATSEPYLYDPKLIGHDSPKRWMQMTLYPLKNANGEILEVILILLDITANKEAEEEIRILNESLEKKVIERTGQLEIANMELESFAYSVSHDLRAPLRIIDGYADILVSDYTSSLDDEGNRMLTIITANARKMGQLIDDLLNLSRLGRKELTVGQVDMTKLVSSVLEDMQMDNNSAIIKIATLKPTSCDNNLMRQVWTNLISNAVKYSGTRENPVIEISSEIKENKIIYSIKDNGVGFDMAYADKLFGVFQRLHKQTEFDGTGVGLALVKRIISKHGGEVWANAAVDKGATFSFSLPV
ncbi:MAG: PAS domain S-box protein [Bacteroidota bacterium]